MSIRLYPYHGASSKERNAVKYKVDSNDVHNDLWTELINNCSDDFKQSYKNLSANNPTLIAKFGGPELENEFQIAKQLETLDLPTFLKYDVLFTNQKCEPERNYTNRPTHNIILMPYINEGPLAYHIWTGNTFSILKNLLKHICLSLSHAYRTLEFTHGDLHIGNVLFTKSTETEISYGIFGKLEVMGFIPIITDYDNSTFLATGNRNLMTDIHSYICLFSCFSNVGFSSGPIQEFMTTAILNKTQLTFPEIIKTLCSLIDNLEVIYFDDHCWK